MRKIESKTKRVGIKCHSASAGESQTSGIWAEELNIKRVSTCVFLCVTLLDEIINQVSYRLHLPFEFNPLECLCDVQTASPELNGFLLFCGTVRQRHLFQIASIFVLQLLTLRLTLAFLKRLEWVFPLWGSHYRFNPRWRGWNVLKCCD